MTFHPQWIDIASPAGVMRAYLALPEGLGPEADAQLAALMALVTQGAISSKQSKEVLDELYATGKDPAQIVEQKGLKQMSDSGALESIIQAIVAQNPAQVQQYRKGKTKVIGFFVGKVMAETKGQANPNLVSDLLKKTLEG